MSKNTTSKNRNEFSGKDCHTHAESKAGKSKANNCYSKQNQSAQNSSYSGQNYAEDEYGKDCGR